MSAPPQYEDPRTVLRRHGLTAQKSWGQNFLINPNAVHRIATACVSIPGIRVLEIGAGLGTLTVALLNAGAAVTAIERDERMVEVLTKEFGDAENCVLHHADAATFDYRSALSRGGGVIAGNLPYQITGIILRQVLHCVDVFDKCVFMVQEEVADRLCAKTTDRTRGALSVIMDARCHLSVLFRLKPTSFYPAPRVRSAVIEIVPRTPSLLANVNEQLFDKIVKAAFGNRRKTIRNAFLKNLTASSQHIDELLHVCDINPGIRAEKIETALFVQMTREAQHRNLFTDTQSAK